MTVRQVVVLLGFVLLVGCTTARPDPAAYARLADSDVTAASATLQATLEAAPDGVGRSWTNPDTGHSGSIRPVATYLAEDGRFCRRYEETLVVGNEQASFVNLACRDPDGGWEWL